MKNNITELVFILDGSGSMAGMEADTVGGFNAMIAQQKEMSGTVYVSTVIFDNVSRVIHDRVPIDQIQPMTARDYRVGGCTALMDAIGGAIHHIRNIHKYARPEDVPEKTVFVITTDGMENASHCYSSREVKDMITLEQKEHSWEFLFMAANIDAAETAATIGIGRESAANFAPTAAGNYSVFEAASEAVCAMRAHAPRTENWKRKIRR